MKKGWFKKSKIKWINKNVYSYELTKRGMFGSDYIRVRKNLVKTVWFGSDKTDWQYDMNEVRGFAEKFIWAQELARKQPKEFYFEYELKKDFKY